MIYMGIAQEVLKEGPYKACSAEVLLFNYPANQGVQSKGHIVIPYTQGLCESIKRICGRYGIQTHFKGGIPSKTYWSSPRTKTLWSTKVVPYTGTNVVT